MSFPPPQPPQLPLSHTSELPRGSLPISDTIGLVAGAAKVSLANSSAALAGRGGEEGPPDALDLERLKREALRRLERAAREQGASGVIEVGFVVEVRAEGVGVLTVDRL